MMSSTNDSETYEIERIVDRRTRNGEVQYYLKWMGYSEEDNTWEPYSNINAKDLISKFEKKRKEKKTLKIKESIIEKEKNVEGDSSLNNALIKPDISTSTETKIISKSSNNESIKRGFDRGLEADFIIGATDSYGELNFLIKWKDCETVDLVPAKLANIQCPQVVIKFYQERLTWTCSESIKETSNQ